MPRTNAKSKNNGTMPCTEESKKSSNCTPAKLPSVSKWGHTLKNYEDRSIDVTIQEDVTFEKMHIKDKVLQGLHSAGFTKPSPVQYKAIPLGKFGVDLIVQAKSGTGKTCVFTVLALEMVVASATTTQVLVLAPTREIAAQITSVIKCIGRCIKGLEVHTLFGGTKVEMPKVCHIAVGTPGRVLHLLSSGKMSGDNIRLLTLDEADQLLDHFKQDVQLILSALPHSKQVVCTSATYTKPLEILAEKMMRSKVHVTLGSEQLHGVTQFIYKLPTNHKSLAFNGKLLPVKAILKSTSFSQCIIFTSSVLNAESIASNLKRSGMPVALLCGGQPQDKRLQALDDLVSFRCRILVATDLAARGLDSAHVSLVISMDPPPSPFTYLHRVGRAGRFGAEGKSVILASEGDDWLHVQAIATKLDVKIYELPEVNMLATSVHHMTVLPHLSLNQFEEWKKNTSHKLSYSDGEDQFGVWKLDSNKSSEKIDQEERFQNEVPEASDQTVTNVITNHDEQEKSKRTDEDIPTLVEKKTNSVEATNNTEVHPFVSDISGKVDHSNELEQLEDLKGKMKSALKYEGKIVNGNKEDEVKVTELDFDLSQEALLREFLQSKDRVRTEEVIKAEISTLDINASSENSVDSVSKKLDNLQLSKCTPSITAEKEVLNNSFSFHLKTLKKEKKGVISMTNRKKVSYKSSDPKDDENVNSASYQTTNYNQNRTFNGHHTRNRYKKTSSSKQIPNGFSNHLEHLNYQYPHQHYQYPPQHYEYPHQHYQYPPQHYQYPPQHYQYPPQHYGYPPELYGFPPQHYGYPPQHYGYPPQHYGYPPELYGYPPQHYGYPPELYGYPPELYGYPPELYGYPPQHYQYPPQHYQYPPQPYGYPSNNKMQSSQQLQTMDAYANNVGLSNNIISKQQNEIYEKTRKDTIKALKRIEKGYTSAGSTVSDDKETEWEVCRTEKEFEVSEGESATEDEDSESEEESETEED